jgi:hypothetical protein
VADAPRPGGRCDDAAGAVRTPPGLDTGGSSAVGALTYNGTGACAGGTPWPATTS